MLGGIGLSPEKTSTAIFPLVWVSSPSEEDVETKRDLHEGHKVRVVELGTWWLCACMTDIDMDPWSGDITCKFLSSWTSICSFLFSSFRLSHNLFNCSHSASVCFSFILWLTHQFIMSQNLIIIYFYHTNSRNMCMKKRFWQLILQTYIQNPTLNGLLISNNIDFLWLEFEFEI